MVSSSVSDFFAHQSQITDPGEFLPLYEELPDNIEQLIAVVNGLLLHANTADALKIRGPERVEEVEVHTVPQILRRAMEITEAPLTLARPFDHRVFVTCGQFAILMASLLRYKGFPARVRYLFPKYYLSDRMPLLPDHAVCEWIREGSDQWELVDAELGGYFERPIARRGKFNIFEIPRDKFVTPSQAFWNISLGREPKPEEVYGYEGLRGFPIVVANLLHDAACLVGTEPLPWSKWGFLNQKLWENIPFLAYFLAKLANAIDIFDSDPGQLRDLMNNELICIPEQFGGRRDTFYRGVS